MPSTVYLVPSFLTDEAKHSIPLYVMEAVQQCQVIFAENERTTRRFLKSMDSSVVIDNFEWHTIHKAENEVVEAFTKAIHQGQNIAIISEAGCPGVADPGQQLVGVAHALNCTIRPLVGPSSILLALMASGMSGQQFEFVGYLPIDNAERIKKIKELEAHSQKNNSTKIFIETPYRNNQLMASLLQHCQKNTKLCVASNITGADEQIHTKSVTDWKNNIPELHKMPVIFLLYAGQQ
jgi:16S rRNA (cytidine1402-2'-O)-methyltransferase